MDYPDLEFGIFLAPFHSLKENPTEALARDIALIEHLEALGYDRAWIGEHHSAGIEIIASPEVFIAAAAERTRHIKFGTGISSLPYQHPLILADRIMQLDHITHGRVAFGVGPSALPSDAFMMGISTEQQRDRTLEAIEVLVPLLRGETVNRKTAWFELNNAQLQLQPYTKPMVDMAVASQISSAGAQTAGSLGLGLLSIGATTAGGFNALPSNWEIYERNAKEHSQIADRSRWSLVGPLHIAETREQAFENVRYGIADWISYFQDVAGLQVAPNDGSDPVEALVKSGMAVIGTADDAIQQIKRLQTQSGGFGSFLQMAHNWADWLPTLKSYELFARHVAPAFQSRNDNRTVSYRQAANQHETFVSAVTLTTGKEIDKDANDVEKKKAKKVRTKTVKMKKPKK